MSATMGDIARRVQVSQATVSRVLSGKGSGFISAATREKVLTAARELGYRPNRLARGLVTGRTGMIAVWIRNPDAPFYARILRCLQSLAVAAKQDIILSSWLDRRVAAPNVHPVLDHAGGEWPVDGVIAVDCPVRAEKYASAPSAPPIVAISSEPAPPQDYVSCDSAQAMREATEHLLALGRRSIAHLSCEHAIPGVRTARMQACRDTATAGGAAFTLLTAADESRSEARAAVASAIASGARFDALTCLNDDMAIGAYKALRDAGVRVPDDVALIGCDGIEDTEYLETPLTTIVQPVDVMARCAHEALQRRLDDPMCPPQHVVLPAVLECRASTLGRAGSPLSGVQVEAKNTQIAAPK